MCFCVCVCVCVSLCVCVCVCCVEGTHFEGPRCVCGNVMQGWPFFPLPSGGISTRLKPGADRRTHWLLEKRSSNLSRSGGGGGGGGGGACGRLKAVVCGHLLQQCHGLTAPDATSPFFSRSCLDLDEGSTCWTHQADPKSSKRTPLPPSFNS